jgi:hypothetical protein
LLLVVVMYSTRPFPALFLACFFLTVVNARELTQQPDVGQQLQVPVGPSPQTAFSAAVDPTSAAVQAPSSDVPAPGMSNVEAAATALAAEPTAAVGTSSDIAAQGSTIAPGPKRLDPAGAGKAHGYYR